MDSVFMFFFCVLLIYSFLNQQKHFLMMLLLIEAFMLFQLYLILAGGLALNTYLFLCLVVFSSCEGALGLSILISVSRCYNTDYLNIFNTHC